MEEEDEQSSKIDPPSGINEQLPYCKQEYESSTSPSYSFTANQWQEISDHGKDASLSENFREKKIERYPERFENLLADISVFGEQELFEDGLDEWEDWDWTPIWEQIVRTEKHTRRSLAWPLGSTKLPQEQMHQRDFGIELGRAVQFLCRPEEEADRETILFGFLLGLMLEDANPEEHELRKVEETLDELKEEFERWMFMHPRFTDYLKSMISNIEGTQKTIEKLLQQKEITITDPVQEHIESQLELEPSLITRQESRRQKNNMVDSVIDDLIEQGILKLEKLGRVVNEDITALRNGDFQEEPYWDIFLHLAERDVRRNQQGIPSQVAKSHRTHVLNILSGRTDHERWQKRPVLQEPADDEWKVTKYGLLLYSGWLSNEEIIPWLHQYVVTPEELSDEEHDVIESVLKDFDK